MDAGDAQVKLPVVVLVEVERSFRVEDVEFCSKQETEAVVLSGHDVEVAEVNGMACAGDAWGMFRNAEDVEMFLLGGSHHLLHGAVGMAAHDGVGVDVKLYH